VIRAIIWSAGLPAMAAGVTDVALIDTHDADIGPLPPAHEGPLQ
jgi:hypothetical protein